MLCKYSLKVGKLMSMKLFICNACYFWRCHSEKVFSRTEVYQPKIESLPLAPEKEAKFLGNVTTNGFSWPDDAVGPATQADKETGLWLDLTLLYLTTSPKHYYTYIICNYIEFFKKH